MWVSGPESGNANGFTSTLANVISHFAQTPDSVTDTYRSYSALVISGLRHFLKNGIAKEVSRSLLITKNELQL